MPRLRRNKQRQKKMSKSKKKTNLGKNVKEGDYGLTEGSLEGELQFIFVTERGYAKC